MQAINPVDVRVEHEWREGSNGKRTSAKAPNSAHRTTPRMKTQVVSKPKTTKKTKTVSTPMPPVPKQAVVPRLVLPVRTPSTSPNRGPWVPPPGRATKGSKVSWQSPESRLEINPVTEFIVDDDGTLNIPSDRQNATSHSQMNTLSSHENEKLMGEIQGYEKRIEGLIDGVGMLKAQLRNHASPQQTDQLRSEIDSSLQQLEQLQNDTTHRLSQKTPKVIRSRSLSPQRARSRPTSIERRPQRRSPMTRVSFPDDPIIPKRRARSTTPIRGPIHLNPDRERLLISLAESEADVAQITRQLSSVKDVLTKLRFENHPLSYEVEQLHQHRNQLLHLIDQFERSNNQLKEFLRHQYHLEAEDGMINDPHDTLKTRIHELQSENEQIRLLLLNRENDNIALQTELERIRTHAISFDTMKTSLEQNRAHLQRELYAREGEISRLRCTLRTLGRDLQRTHHLTDARGRSRRRSPMISTPARSSPSPPASRKKAISVEKLHAQLVDRDHQIDALRKKLYESKGEQTDDTSSEVVHLRARLEQAERLANEYKAQLQTEALKTSANNSKNHLSELELERTRVRLQKRIEELEPLPELLKQMEMKNEKLQRQLLDVGGGSAKPPSAFTDRTEDKRFAIDDVHILQRKIASLEQQNAKLLQAFNAKEEELRVARSHPSSKSPDFTTIHKPLDFKFRDDAFASKDHLTQKNTYNLEQQISKLQLEYAQLKREKEELERNFKSQLSELRDKLEQSSSANRSMQNYLNSLKKTYANLFGDTLPTSLAGYSAT